MTRLSLFFVFLLAPLFCFAQDKTVLISILARNKAHMLDRYLHCIEQLDYDKKAITIYINTNNNIDHTEEILRTFARKNEKAYKEIILQSHDVKDLSQSNPHAWNIERFKVLGHIRNQSMQMALDKGCEYYFVIDCDNFIAPSTLKTLVKKNKPIVAPMLTAIPEKNDIYANFFCDVDDSGYYKHHPDYMLIYHRQKIGTHLVPVVHCTYLIDAKFIPKLTYVDGTNDFEFVIFSNSARRNGVEQYICNEENFGVLVHFFEDFTIGEEARIMKPFLSVP